MELPVKTNLASDSDWKSHPRLRLCERLCGGNPDREKPGADLLMASGVLTRNAAPPTWDDAR